MITSIQMICCTVSKLKNTKIVFLVLFLILALNHFCLFLIGKNVTSLQIAKELATRPSRVATNQENSISESNSVEQRLLRMLNDTQSGEEISRYIETSSVPFGP